VSDDAAREQAAHGYDENLVVVAGAGSGKTSLLVERLLCQMIEGDLLPEQFAAITFTEKAAAEMRHRVEAGLARLVARAEGTGELPKLDPGEEADRAFAWLHERVAPAVIAERARDRLFALAETEVTTIHGFSARLLRRHPLEAGVDPDFQVDTGGRFADLVEEIWERFLSGPDGLEGAAGERFSRVLDLLALREVEDLASMAATFAISDESLAAPLPGVREVLGPWLDAKLRAIDSLGFGISPALGPESYVAAARGTLIALRDSGPDAFRQELEGARFERKTGSCGLLEVSGGPTSGKHLEASALADELYKQLKKLRRIDDDLLRDALALILPFAREVRAEARRRGILPFDALLVLTRELLANHPEVRLAVGARYRVLFLDEFQDTDPLQYEIVFLISEPPGGAPRAGSLFIVGDPKQAIYRFRGADITAYKEAVARILAGPGEQPLVLTRNFRAVPELLRPLDRLFRQTFEPPSGSAESLAAYVSYDGLEATRDAAGEPRIERWSIGDKASAEVAREREAEAIASWVAREVAAGRFRPRCVALLLRALTDALVYVRAFQRRDIAVWVGRTEEADRDPALQQLTALLRALGNPADAPAVLGFLRSPLGGVPDAELARHATQRRGSWLYTTAPVDAAAVPNLARAFASLARWHARVANEPLARVLAALRDETPLLALHAAALDGVRRVADLSAMLDRLGARASAAPELDLSHWVATLVSEEQRRSAAEPLPDTDAVRVLSVHGAKGLEFDVVVLADLARGEPPYSDDALRFSREQSALAVRTRAASSSTWLERDRIEEAHKDAESRRLFYVAATRAKERLIVVEAARSMPAGKNTFGQLLKAWSDPEVAVREISGVDVQEPTRLESLAGPSALAALERTEAAATVARSSARPPLARPSGISEEEEGHAGAGADLDESLPLRVAAARETARELARASGSALHELLERWDFRGAESARALLGAAVTRAARRSSAPESAIALDAGAVLETLLASKLPGALASVEVLGRELPLLFRDTDGRGWSGTLDLLYRDPDDGRLVVADYKTDRAPDAAARASYRAQLEVYARGVARLFPGEPPPRLELLWLRTGQRERLPLESAP
jgi:ATP-dependent helicase/nuclease subunit A